ncbi:MAG: thermonuclease family protein [Chromatiaceae bacterium]|nr:thermonuclease family protein [Chromatiaceae bacterium]MBP8283243.1 thermonuclease family protein [Chromatiaceae bacterium]MBP8288285.1 thermonuclease family protein [Chromatiaceae bacterium]MBP9605210.1 thermonuclease family protein [Chromatiaceae bacterium]
MSELMRLTYTYDGDTLGATRTVNGQPEQVKLRLAYIDAPEMAQSPWGIRARSYLRTLLYVNEPILVDVIGSDKYGRLIAEVLRKRDYGNLGLRLALGGYAALWMCPSTQQGYQAAQAIAQYKKVGIWSLPGIHQTPWLYR